jgi:hypothetical protein
MTNKLRYFSGAFAMHTFESNNRSTVLTEQSMVPHLGAGVCSTALCFQLLLVNFWNNDCVIISSQKHNQHKICRRSIITSPSLWRLSLTPTHSWSWALLEKPPIVQPLKNFPAFYGTRRFITMFTRALHWSLSWARSIQFIPSHSVSLRSILILSTHLRLGL